MAKAITSSARWKRVFDLRRALIPYILMAGERPPMPKTKEQGPQRYVSLSDDFDDVLYTALEKEADLERLKAEKRPVGRKRG